MLRHSHFKHSRRDVWICPKFFFSANGPILNVVCGYCGITCPRTSSKSHFEEAHGAPQCSGSAAMFFRTEDFRQHLIHSHAATPSPFLDQLIKRAHRKAKRQVPIPDESAIETQSLLMTSRKHLEDVIVLQNFLIKNLDKGADDYEQRLATCEAYKLKLERDLAAISSGSPLAGVNGANDERHDPIVQPDLASLMHIPNTYDKAPPALPSPTHISDIASGQDPGWHWGNDPTSTNFGHSAPVESGLRVLDGSLRSLLPTKELENVHNGSMNDGRRGSSFDFQERSEVEREEFPLGQFSQFSESEDARLDRVRRIAGLVTLSKSNSSIDERREECPPDRYSQGFDREHRAQSRTPTHAAPSVWNPPLSAVVDIETDLGVSQRQAEIQETSQSQGNHASGLFATLFRVLVRRCRPKLRQSYSRLEWRCSCGQQFWGDFKNDEPEKLHRLVSELQQHGFAVDTTTKTTTALDTSSTTGNSTSSQNTATSASTSSPNSSPSTSGAVTKSISATPSSTTSPAVRQTTVSAPTTLQSIGKPVYLELCINRSSRVTQLGEIIIVDGRGKQLINTDLELFGKCSVY
jgi:hypothetical protein